MPKTTSPPIPAEVLVPRLTPSLEERDSAFAKADGFVLGRRGRRDFKFFDEVPRVGLDQDHRNLTFVFDPFLAGCPRRAGCRTDEEQHDDQARAGDPQGSSRQAEGTPMRL
jgi:hypothetical protein